MRTRIRPRQSTALRTAALAATAALALAMPVTGSVPASASQGVVTHFVFTAGSADTIGDSAYINNPATNDQGSALLFVTPNYDPGGGCGCVFDSAPIGVWYNRALGQWAVFNENGDAMPLNESFNVLVVPTDKTSHSVFLAESIPNNTVGDYTFISNSVADGNPYAKIQVTQNFGPDGLGGTYNAHPIGVWYDNAAGLWAIFNEDQAPMPIGAHFNVLVGAKAKNGGGTAALLRTTASNSSADTTYINNPATNGNPGNITFVTPNYDPGGKGGTYNDVQTGVWYPSPQEGVFNENGSSPPLHSADNLLIFPS
jgi:hypothetical protein